LLEKIGSSGIIEATRTRRGKERREENRKCPIKIITDGGTYMLVKIRGRKRKCGQKVIWGIPIRTLGGEARMEPVRTCKKGALGAGGREKT